MARQNPSNMKSLEILATSGIIYSKSYPGFAVFAGISSCEKNHFWWIEKNFFFLSSLFLKPSIFVHNTDGVYIYVFGSQICLLRKKKKPWWLIVCCEKEKKTIRYVWFIFFILSPNVFQRAFFFGVAIVGLSRIQTILSILGIWLFHDFVRINKRKIHQLEKQHWLFAGKKNEGILKNVSFQTVLLVAQYFISYSAENKNTFLKRNFWTILLSFFCYDSFNLPYKIYSIKIRART